MKHVISAAKLKLRPSAKELKRKSAIAEYTLGLVNDAISGIDKIHGAQLGGSFAKGTWLTGADIDIFVIFDISVPEKELESIARRIGFSSMRKYAPYVRYASHPYVEANVRGTKVNVVPCYDVENGQWRSAADRSRFHTVFMRKSLTSSMCNDVRVLKKMLQSNNLYGAELALEAFSGYSCEVLIHTYGSLARTIRTLAHASDGLVVGRSSIEPITRVAIMDPIDDTRNLSTAVSAQNMARFIMLCRTFLKKPASAIIFTKPRRKPNINVLKTTVVIRFKATLRPPETVWGQAKSATVAIASRLDSFGFSVTRHGAHVTDSMQVTLGFVLESLFANFWSVGKGPEYFAESHTSEFVKKNIRRTPLVWVAPDGRLRALRMRDYEKAADLLHDTLTHYIRRSGIPGGLKRDIRAGFSIRAGLRVSDAKIIDALSDLVSTDPRTVS